MDDQGELIVRLARQMLDADPQLGMNTGRRRSGRLWPWGLLIAVLATVSGGATGWALHVSDRPMDRAERFEMAAMIAYTAHLKNQDEASLREQLAARFEVATLDNLPAHDLLPARNWLARRAE